MAHWEDYRVAGGIQVRRLSWAFWYAPPHFVPPVGGEQLMMIGWAYLMAAIMTIDALLLGLLLLNVKWPKRWKKN